HSLDLGWNSSLTLRRPVISVARRVRLVTLEKSIRRGSLIRTCFARSLRRRIANTIYCGYRYSTGASHLCTQNCLSSYQLCGSHRLGCFVSSNLNMVRRLDDLFRAEPTLFRISLSGFTQKTYGQSHVRGNIERVKENMRLVAESRRRVGNKTTDVQVYF